MNLVVDTHTHTLASGHAYSTIIENAREAGINGMEAIAMTDHGPAMPGASSLLHFWNLKAIPERIYGVRVIKGAETNILDYSGSLDIPAGLLARMEFVIASYHDNVLKPGTVEENTEGMIKVLKDPCVDAVAHPGNPVFQVDIERVVRTAAEYGKLIEINNNSFRIRKGSEVNCIGFVEQCKKQGVRITCGTDSHICFDIGHFENIRRILYEAQMPEELVLCTSFEKVDAFLKERKPSKLQASTVE
ncbi:MAG TPA: phosphatase [Clostridia bacterium]|nr:phosphatase [Clostridia bacterium]